MSDGGPWRELNAAAGIENTSDRLDAIREWHSRWVQEAHASAAMADDFARAELPGLVQKMLDARTEEAKRELVRAVADRFATTEERHDIFAQVTLRTVSLTVIGRPA